MGKLLLKVTRLRKKIIKPSFFISPRTCVTRRKGHNAAERNKCCIFRGGKFDWKVLKRSINNIFYRHTKRINERRTWLSTRLPSFIPVCILFSLYHRYIIMYRLNNLKHAYIIKTIICAAVFRQQ